MNKLKRWDRKLARAWDRVGRGKKLALNLTACALIGGLIWMRLGWPLPPLEMEFRRAERTHLLAPSEIVFQYNGVNENITLIDGPERMRLHGKFVVGLREDRIMLFSLERGWSDWRRSVSTLPRGESPVLAPILQECKYVSPVGWWAERRGSGYGDAHDVLPFLLLEAPAETAQVELTIRDEEEGEAFTGGGWQMEDGNWLLCLECDLMGRNILLYQKLDYELRLFAADGGLLLERSGELGTKSAPE